MCVVGQDQHDHVSSVGGTQGEPTYEGDPSSGMCSCCVGSMLIDVVNLKLGSVRVRPYRALLCAIFLSHRCPNSSSFSVLHKMRCVTQLPLKLQQRINIFFATKLV